MQNGTPLGPARPRLAQSAPPCALHVYVLLRCHAGTDVSGALDPTCNAAGGGAPKSEDLKKAKQKANEGGARDPTCNAAGGGATKSGVPKKSEGPKKKKKAHKGGAQDPTCKAAGAQHSKQKAGKKKAAKSAKAKARKARRANGKIR